MKVYILIMFNLLCFSASATPPQEKELLMRSYSYDYHFLISCLTDFENKGFSPQVQQAEKAATNVLTKLWGIGGKGHPESKKGSKDAAIAWLEGESDKTSLCLQLMNEWD